MISSLPPSYVSLFSSGGIADVGLKQAGFKCVASAELLSRRIEVQRLNGIAHENALVCGDLNLPGVFERVLSETKSFMTSTKGPLTLLLATPPCQGMSVANHKKNDELKRNSLVVRSIEAIELLKPLVFIFENVPSFMKTLCTGLDDVDRPIGDEVERVLGASYEYYSKVVKLHEHGSPSSRTRSITVGVRNDISWVTPLDLFPNRSPAPSLRELIGQLQPLHEMGEVAQDDPLHAFRSYDPRMRPWIQGLKEGESAFDNTNPALRPHRILNGTFVPNVNKNGDKYKRVHWDKIAPCVHTRNDILASQNTVHPSDDRVFSVRELMRMMGLPDDFVWFRDQHKLTEMSSAQQYSILRKHEPNIRQCLGEAVPVPVMRSIGFNIQRDLLGHLERRRGRIVRSDRREWTTLAQKAAYYCVSESQKRNFSAYYTEPLAAFALLKRSWESIRGLKGLSSVIEPSAGGGVFAVILAQMIENERISLTVCEIDENVIEYSKSLLVDLKSKYENVDFVCGNFLELDFEKPFALCIGNPPFGRKKAGSADFASGEIEISARFLRKAMVISNYVAFVFPKAFLHSAAYYKTRQVVAASCNATSIIDFGEIAFPDVKVETIGLVLETLSTTTIDRDSLPVRIKSWPSTTRFTQELGYIIDDTFPSWLIYRDNIFDWVLSFCTPGMFGVWRDRVLSRRLATDEGSKVIRGRNLSSAGKIVDDARDYYVPLSDSDSIRSRISQLRGSHKFLVPNLSYYPRAVKYSDLNLGVPEGSCAVLHGDLSDDQAADFLAFSRTQLFAKFYRVACNRATRSINVDWCLAFWWVVPVSTASLGPVPDFYSNFEMDTSFSNQISIEV